MDKIIGLDMMVVKEWLNQHERSGSWLARKLAVSPVSVHYWLNGVHSPSNKHKSQIEDIIGIKI